MGPRPGTSLEDGGWAELRSRLWKGRVSPAKLGDRLEDIAGTLRGRLARAGTLPDEWRPLGVEVREIPMRGRGSCFLGDSSRTIYVNVEDKRALQRFTVAHELAHLLLGGRLAEREGGHGSHAEERLCDRFASAILVPREELAAQLRVYGLPPGPDDILRLCGHFGVNVRPVLFAVGEQLEDSESFLLLARFHGHRRRPAEVAFRVVATAGARHAYFPRHQRLASLGLQRLAEVAERAAHGDVIAGTDPDVVLGLRGLSGKRSSATAKGPVGWRACRLGKDSPYVIAVLDLSTVLSRPRQRSAA